MDNLSTELRGEYRRKLAEKGREWVIVPAFVAGLVGAILLLEAITGATSGGMVGVVAVIIIGAIAAGAADHWWKAYRRKVISAWPDDLLIYKYGEFRDRKRRHVIWGAAALVIVVVLVAMVAVYNPSGMALFLSSASCNVVEQRTNTKAFFTNGSLDAGYEVNAQVHNTGGAGVVRIDAVLSTSEGTFAKTRDVQFAAGETKEATFEFPEPTINASNVEGSVSCRP